MARIALVNIGMHGHVNPTLGFTRELIRRGHEVFFFSTPEFAKAIAQTGAHFVSYPTTLGQNVAEYAKIQAESTAQGIPPPASGSVITRFVDEFQGTFPELFKSIQDLSPDILVYDFVSFAAKIVADHCGINAIKFFTTYASNDRYNLMKETFAKHDFPTPAQIMAAQSLIDDLCAAVAVKPASLAQSLSAIDQDNLVFMPRGFQPFGETFDERFHFVGPCVRESDAAVAAPLIPPGEGPVMIISLGSLFHEWPAFYRACIQAFGGSAWRIVMGVGAKLDLAELGPIPENMHVLRHLPQVELLQHADLFISHGGMNSTMESLYYGVPLVVIPQIEEQEVTARRVGEMRLGQYLTRAAVNAQVLADAVAEVFGNPEILHNVQGIQEQIRASGGSPRTADLIENRITSRGPATRQEPALLALDNPRLARSGDVHDA